MKTVWWSLVAVLMTASLVACGGGGASTPCMTDAECPSGSGCVEGMCAEGESGRDRRDASGEGDAEASGQDAAADTAEELDASPEPDVSEDDSGAAIRARARTRWRRLRRTHRRTRAPGRAP